MIQVLKKAADILDVIAELAPVTHGQILRRTGLHKATLSNILSTLIDTGFVEKTSSGQFCLGAALLKFSLQRKQEDVLPGLAQAYADALSDQISEKVSVSTMRNGHRFRLATAHASQSVIVDAQDDKLACPYGTATGRVLLAFAASEELEKAIQAYGLPENWAEVSSRASLLAELERIRTNGEAYRTTSDGHVETVAVPVFSGDGAARISIGVSALAHRFGGTHRRKIMKALHASAESMAEEVAARFGLPVNDHS